jgi:RHS repeat-associated protein
MSYDTFQLPATHTRSGITTNYRFNAQDQRVMKSQAGGTVTHRYAYAGQNTLLAERFGNTSTGASQWTSYLWLDGQPVGLVKGNTLYWVTADHLGRPEVVTNASQQIVWRAANQAFDRSVLVDQIGGYRLGFPGQSLDAESGLWHNGFRDYDASLGRYVQSDPIGLLGGVSTYTYVSGDPVKAVDPLGLQSCVCGEQVDRRETHVSVFTGLEAVRENAANNAAVGYMTGTAGIAMVFVPLSRPAAVVVGGALMALDLTLVEDVNPGDSIVTQAEYSPAGFSVEMTFIGYKGDIRSRRVVQRCYGVE